MPRDQAFLWVNKTAESSLLSRSEHEERLRVFSQAQRISRSARKRAIHPPRPAFRTGAAANKKSKPEQDGQEADVRSQTLLAPTNETNRLPTAGRPPISRGSETLRYAIGECLTRDPSWTSKELRGVAFYRSVTLRKIITLRQDHLFWEDTILRLAEFHAEIRHLVVAIAATHELLYEVDIQELDTYAVVQCNKAVALLQALDGWNPTLILVSCILISALSILRCDLSQADKTIESGSKIMKMIQSNPPDEKSPENLVKFGKILSRLGTQHGYKLWAPEIAFRFEKASASNSDLVIDTNCVKGPFIDPDHAARTCRIIMIEVITKVMRNLARGAHIDPNSPFVQETLNQLSLFSFYWQLLYNSLPQSCDLERLQLKQIRVGFNAGCLMFLTKIACPEELYFDAQPGICDSTFELIEEVVTARHTGHPVTHVDRFVNGILFSLGLSCGSQTRRQRAIRLLRSQTSYEHEVLNWVRAMAIDAMSRLEEQRLGYSISNGTPRRNPQILLDGLLYVELRQTIRVEYTMVEKDSPMEISEFPIEVKSWPGRSVTESEINDCLQGIVTAYRMYRKPHASKAPRGFVSTMYHLDRQIPVHWNLNTDTS